MRDPYLSLSDAPKWVTDLQDRRRLRRHDRWELQADVAEQLVAHAGHPLDANRWCVDDLCNQQALAEQAALRGDDPLNVFRKGGA